MWGPVPRTVFQTREDLADAAGLIANQEEKELARIVFERKYSSNFITEKISARIYTPFIDPNTFLLKEVGFISDYFLRAVLMKGANIMAAETGSYLAAMLRNPAMLSTHYHFFELWAIYQLRQDKPLKIKELGSYTQVSPESNSFAKKLLPLTDRSELLFPKAGDTVAINAADNEDVQKYIGGQRLIMRAGFLAIDTVENTWMFTKATTNMSHGLFVQGENDDSGLIHLVNSMSEALGEKPSIAVAFLWLVNRSNFSLFPLQAHKNTKNENFPFGIIQYAVEIPDPGPTL
jgi:hypothetical protein